MIRFVLTFCLVAIAQLSSAATEIEEFTTPGGIEVWLVNEPSIPIVALEVSFKGGSSIPIGPFGTPSRSRPRCLRRIWTRP